ncbi:MAG TPA: phage major capsid protein, partial [Candidatus Cloacimonadota bacterium]|nr:phage major capsid protein [Candidatus Cloacimonadota bacterium]
MTDDLRAEFDALVIKRDVARQDLKRMEAAETVNLEEAKRDFEPVERNEKPIAVQFRDWLKDAVEGKASTKFEFRAEPILSTTQTAIINKTVANSLDILTSPGEAFLRGLGVSFYTGLNGQLVLPSMAQDTGVFMLETSTAEAASMTPEALTLAPRRVTHYQTVTRELLSQTNPAIFQGIMQNLYNGVYNAVANDWADTIESDGATQIKVTGTTITYQNLCDMEASIGGLSIGAAKYVTTPTGKAFLKGLNAGNAGIKFAWADDNTIAGYPAFAAPCVNANRVYFGDFSRTNVAQWGDLEIIVDPYTDAKKGQIILTIVGLFDT